MKSGIYFTDIILPDWLLMNVHWMLYLQIGMKKFISFMQKYIMIVILQRPCINLIVTSREKQYLL